MPFAVLLLPSAVALVPVALELGPQAKALAPVAVAVPAVMTQVDCATAGRGVSAAPSTSERPVKSAKRSVPLASVPLASALPPRRPALRLRPAESFRPVKYSARCPAGAVG